MSSSTPWGCCENATATEKHLPCNTCKKFYHFACVSLTENLSKSAMSVWKCPLCQGPRSSKNDNTPVRNITTTRGSKKKLFLSHRSRQSAKPLPLQERKRKISFRKRWMKN